MSEPNNNERKEIFTRLYSRVTDCSGREVVMEDVGREVVMEVVIF